MRTVLVVSDDGALRSTLASALEAEGWTVSQSSSGELGVQHAFATSPDLLIAQIDMSGVTGLQLCQLVRGDPSMAHMRVVLVGASGDRRARFVARRSGADALLDARDLDALVATARRFAPDAEEVEPFARKPREAIRESSIPRRLSSLLEQALFEAMVTSELRAIAFDARDMDALFGSLARLLSELIAYEWLAISVNRGEMKHTWLHQRAGDPEQGHADVASSLGLNAQEAAFVRVISEEVPAEAGEGGVVRAHALQLHGRILGRLTVRLATPRPTQDDATVLALAAREVALPLHAVMLMEETGRLASTDMLTGLANRRIATEALSRELESRDRRPRAVGVALVDVDFFKRINDRHGHSSGDRALQHVAQVLLNTARTGDLFARWGGEEFLVLLSNVSDEGARVAAERIRRALAAQPVELEGGTAVPLTVSVGVALGRGRGMDAVLEAADAALYAAKARGRNQVVMEDELTPEELSAAER
ncbi:MAG: diguanylate cyclase [Polyangiales bacterium]